MTQIIQCNINDLQELIAQYATSPYLTIKEAADYLRESETTLLRRIASRELKENEHYFKKPNGKILFRRDRLDAWLMNPRKEEDGKHLSKKGDSLRSIIDGWAKDSGITQNTGYTGKPKKSA